VSLKFCVGKIRELYIYIFDLGGFLFIQFNWVLFLIIKILLVLYFKLLFFLAIKNLSQKPSLSSVLSGVKVIESQGYPFMPQERESVGVTLLIPASEKNHGVNKCGCSG